MPALFVSPCSPPTPVPEGVFIDILPFTTPTRPCPRYNIAEAEPCLLSPSIAAMSPLSIQQEKFPSTRYIDVYSILFHTELSQHQMSYTFSSKHSPQETPFHPQYILASSHSSKTRKQLLPSGIDLTLAQLKTATPNISQAYITDSISSSPHSVLCLFTDHHEGVYVPPRR